MYKLEFLGDNNFYLKVIGNFPPTVAETFKDEFLKKTEDLDSFSVIVDLSNADLVRLSSIDIILDLLKENNKKLTKSAYIIIHNPPLSEELKYVIEEAKSPKRKIVKSLKEAKKWIGIKDVIIHREDSE
ncbi:MAG: hypothetical protein BAJALOKI2v1_660001 [Promethearchaeota archaeon]|nr:MAG: hypothetical protein BAJALOKI2v1_660001 [Candidatus Lokiarchaeota archaeon]